VHVKNYHFAYINDCHLATSSTTAMNPSTNMASTTYTSMTTTTTAATQQTSSQCYDCSGPDCGKEGSTLSMGCPTCMVHRNADDQSKTSRIIEKTLLL
jgi:hypothetical protein